MKIILKEDVFKLGSLGDEVEVKSGYARNYLIPQGKALLLNRENVKQISHHKSILAKKRADAIAQARSFGQKIEDAELIFTMKSGEGGKLFGSVTQKHIYDALVEAGIELDRKKLGLPSPIKNLGKHVIPVKLHTEVVSNLKIKVVAEVTEEDSQPADGEAEAVDAAATSEEKPVEETAAQE